MHLLLLPGFMTDDDLWSDLVPHLQPHAVHFGDVTQDSSIAAMAERGLAEAPPRFVAVGFSMGGYVAREMARRAPGRVQALVLIATSARGDSGRRAAQLRMAVARSGTVPWRGLSRSSVAGTLHPSRAGDAALVDRLHGMSVRLGRDVFVRQSSPRSGDMERLGEIGCPTLVIASAEDRTRSVEESGELAAAIPGATLKTIPGAGHMLPVEAPGVLAGAMLSWLRGVVTE